MENKYNINYFLSQKGETAGKIFAVIIDEDFNKSVFERSVLGRNVKWSVVKDSKLSQFSNCNEQNLEDIFKNPIQGQKYRHPKAYHEKYPSELVLAKSNEDFYFVLNKDGQIEVLEKEYTDDKENSIFEKTNIKSNIDNIKEEFDSEFLSQYKSLENAVREYKNNKVTLPDWLLK